MDLYSELPAPAAAPVPPKRSAKRPAAAAAAAQAAIDEADAKRARRAPTSAAQALTKIAGAIGRDSKFSKASALLLKLVRGPCLVRRAMRLHVKQILTFSARSTQAIRKAAPRSSSAPLPPQLPRGCSETTRTSLRSSAHWRLSSSGKSGAAARRLQSQCARHPESRPRAGLPRAACRSSHACARRRPPHTQAAALHPGNLAATVRAAQHALHGRHVPVRPSAPFMPHSKCFFLNEFL